MTQSIEIGQPWLDADQSDGNKPYIERWQGADCAMSEIVRLDATQHMAFDRHDNKSGFRNAYEYFKQSSGLVAAAEMDDPRPIMMITSSNGTIEFYDGRQGAGRWYGLLRQDNGAYDVAQTAALSKDTIVHIVKGDAVYVGTVSANAAQGNPSPDEPSHELFRRIASQADAYRGRPMRSVLGLLRKK